MEQIPMDVLDYMRYHFAECNRSVAEELSLFPGAYEEHLDMNLISYWSKRQAPIKLNSNWIVRADVNFMGGGRHYGAWEVADIGIILIFRKNGKVIRSKMAFLQSKKLYAIPLKNEPSRNQRYGYGMGGLLVTEERELELITRINYKFSESSRYEAFQVGSEQQSAMSSFQRKHGMTMHYMFYNPFVIPHTITNPIEGDGLSPTPNSVGCRVMRKNDVDTALKNNNKGYKPTYGDIKYMLPMEFTSDHEAGWRLEYFIVDLMMGCKEGVIDDSPSFEILSDYMNQKSRPMNASIAFTFDANE